MKLVENFLCLQVRSLHYMSSEAPRYSFIQSPLSRNVRVVHGSYMSTSSLTSAFQLRVSYVPTKKLKSL